MNVKLNKMIKNFLIYVVLSLLAVASIYPLLYTFTNSFMGASEFKRYYGELSNGITNNNPFHLIPEWATLSGYRDVFLSRPDYLIKFWISLFLSITILIGQLVMSVLGGYAFARYRFPGRNVLFFAIILLMLMPYQVTLVPNYIVLNSMGLLDSYMALILPGLFSAFGVFLIRQVMLSLPNSIFEAAQLDGAGATKILIGICLPNCKAGIGALIVLSFADSWNMMEQPLTFLKDPFKYPLSLFLMSVNTLNPALSFVCGILSILPMLLLFLGLKDEMISGIEYSGVR